MYFCGFVTNVTLVKYSKRVWMKPAFSIEQKWLNYHKGI